ncbi:MAG: HD-GYP domain-containing protein, partial [Planctomycetota bacterium]
MEELSIARLRDMSMAPQDLYLKWGQKIFMQDDVLNGPLVDVLEQAGVKSLFSVMEFEREQFLFDAVNQKIDLDSPVLRREGRLQQSVFNTQGELVLRAGEIWTRDLARDLLKQQERVLYLRREPEKCLQDEERAQTLIDMLDKERARQLSLAPKPKKKTSFGEIREDFGVLDKSAFTANGLDAMEAGLDKEAIPDSKDALFAKLKARPADAPRSQEELDEIRQLHAQGMRDLRTLMDSLALQRDTSARSVSELSKNIIEALVRDKDLLLNMNNVEVSAPFHDYVYSHSLNSGIMSINIATAMNYSAQQVYEMSFGAFLHDVGMLRVPTPILTKKGPLNDEERAEVSKHVAGGLDLLQKLQGIPSLTPLIAYQSHERGDRSGYPRRKALANVNPYTRIVMVADIFCAMTSNRSYRRAYTPY